MYNISSDAIESLVEREMDYGMTHEQIKNFVVNSHVTDKRKLRQVLVEIERRNHDRKKCVLDRKRKEVEIARLKDRVQITEDPYERQLMEFDIEEYEIDRNKYNVTLHQYDNELAAFMDWINKHWGSIEEVAKAAEYTEEDERKYWIARMGKQAAMDVYTTGKIGTGNLDSIAMMREDDQYATLNVAMQYSGLLNTGISKIQNELRPHLDKLMMDGTSTRIPTMEGIEDNLNLKLYDQLAGNEQKSIQSADKSETE